MPPGYMVLLAVLSAHLALPCAAEFGRRIPLVFLAAMDPPQNNLEALDESIEGLEVGVQNTLEGQDESTEEIEVDWEVGEDRGGSILEDELEEKETKLRKSHPGFSKKFVQNEVKKGKTHPGFSQNFINSEEILVDEESRKGKSHPGFSQNFGRKGKELGIPNFLHDVVRADDNDPWRRGSFGERISSFQNSGGPRRRKNDDRLVKSSSVISLQEPGEARSRVLEDEQFRSKNTRNIVLSDPEDWSQETGIHRQNSPGKRERTRNDPNRAKILIQDPGAFRPSRTIQSSRSNFNRRKSYPGFSGARERSKEKIPSNGHRFNGEASGTQTEKLKVFGTPSTIKKKPTSNRKQETTLNDPVKIFFEQVRQSQTGKKSHRFPVTAKEDSRNQIVNAGAKNIDQTTAKIPENEVKNVGNQIFKTSLKKRIVESDINNITSDDRFSRSLLNTFPFKPQGPFHTPQLQHSHPLVPSQSVPISNSRQREDSPASFDDVASVKPDRDGQRCIDKVIMVEETEFDEYVECYHSYDKRCHTTYVTNFEPTQEEECDENYRKKCFIEYSTSAYNQTVEVCHEPLVKDCDLVGPEICSTQYESECWTKLEEHDVVDDVPECIEVKEQKCEDITIGYTSQQKCTEWPIQKCSLTKANVRKTSPITKCEKVPKQVCAPAGCGFVPGPKTCYEKKEIVISDRPEESCSLEPQTTCKHVTKLVPKLEPKEECLDVPKELCTRSSRNPRKIRKPVVKKWCYTPSEESGLA